MINSTATAIPVTKEPLPQDVRKRLSSLIRLGVRPALALEYVGAWSLGAQPQARPA